MTSWTAALTSCCWHRGHHVLSRILTDEDIYLALAQEDGVAALNPTVQTAANVHNTWLVCITERFGGIDSWARLQKLAASRTHVHIFACRALFKGIGHQKTKKKVFVHKTFLELLNFSFNKKNQTNKKTANLFSIVYAMVRNKCWFLIGWQLNPLLQLTYCAL